VKLVQTVAYKLGVHPKRLSAEFDTLIFMEKGSCITKCSNCNESKDDLGSLVIQLPSEFTGGKISIFHEDQEKDNEDETTSIFDLGVSSGEAPFSCQFVCHYKDCFYEFSKVKSGSRVLLHYSL